MVTAALHPAAGRTPHIRVPEFDPYRTVQISIPSADQHVHEVRQLLERVCVSTWLTADDIAELKLAATEACLNAIRHGSPNGRASVVGVVVKPGVDQVIIEVRDQGAGFDVRAVRRSPFPLGENGRGVKLIDTLVDRAEYYCNGHGHCVRLTKRSRFLATLH